MLNGVELNDKLTAADHVSSLLSSYTQTTFTEKYEIVVIARVHCTRCEFSATTDSQQRHLLMFSARL